MIVNFLNLGTLEIISLFPVLLWVIFFVIAFVKCVTNNYFTPIEKAVWVLVICLAPFFGAIAYLIAYGKNRKKEPVQRYYGEA